MNTLPAHIADKIKQEADNQYSLFGQPNKEVFVFQKGAEFGYSLRDKEGWVRVEDGLPNYLRDDEPSWTEQVVIQFSYKGFTSNDYITTGALYDGSWHFWENRKPIGEDVRVIRWMPLPAPPVESTSSPQEGSVRDTKVKMTVEQFIGTKVVADPESGGVYIMGNSLGYYHPICEVRGWGAIQQLFRGKEGKIDVEKAEMFQDELGKYIADAINQKLQSKQTNKNG